MCEEGHARRGQGGLCTLCGDEEGKDSPGGWREGVNKVVLLKVPRGSDPKEIISELPIVVNLFFHKF